MSQLITTPNRARGLILSVTNRNDVLRAGPGPTPPGPAFDPVAVMYFNDNLNSRVFDVDGINLIYAGASVDPAGPRINNALTTFSDDGKYLASLGSAADGSGILLLVYQRSAGGFEVLPGSGVIHPGGVGTALTYAGGGAFVVGDPAGVRVVKALGGVITQVVDPITFAGSVQDLFYTGGVLFITTSEPRLLAYSLDTTNEQVSFITSTTEGLAVSARGLRVTDGGGVFVIQPSEGNYVKIFQFEGGVFTPQPDPAFTISGNPFSIDLSTQGDVLAVGHVGGDFITFYAVEGTSLTRVTPQGSLPDGVTRVVSFNPNGSAVYCGHDSGDFLKGFSVGREEGQITISGIAGTPPDLAVRPSAIAWSPD